jgi:glycosyltransferase involved in cell wall biosynthesis
MEGPEMDSPLVSVVIPNYNYALYLAEAIESVLSQTYVHIELIVVDDGSTDASAQVARNFGDRLMLIEQKNAGVSAARNRGMAAANGEFIAFLDSDDKWRPTKIERQLKEFQSDGEVGLVHCGYVELNRDGSLGPVHLDGQAGDVALELVKYQRPVILGGGSGVIIRRSLLKVVGGFDPSVSPAEDWEFYFRCARTSKVGFVPEVLLEYREHQNNAHLNIPRMEGAILRAFDKAFSNSDPQLQAIRHRCYGKIHSVLAGSYFRKGSYWQFARHSFKSAVLSPRELTRYLSFPFRSARRWLTQNQ